MYTRRYTQCRQTIRTTVYKGSSRDYQLSTYTEIWNKRWHRYYVSYFCTFEMTLKSFSHFVLYHLFSDQLLILAFYTNTSIANQKTMTERYLNMWFLKGLFRIGGHVFFQRSSNQPLYPSTQESSLIQPPQRKLRRVPISRHKKHRLISYCHSRASQNVFFKLPTDFTVKFTYSPTAFSVGLLNRNIETYVRDAQKHLDKNVNVRTSFSYRHTKVSLKNISGQVL